MIEYKELRCQICGQLKEEHTDTMIKACNVDKKRGLGKYPNCYALFVYNYGIEKYETKSKDN